MRTALRISTLFLLLLVRPLTLLGQVAYVNDDANITLGSNSGDSKNPDLHLVYQTNSTGANVSKIALLSFDLSNVLPANLNPANIQKATLVLFLEAGGNPGQLTVCPLATPFSSTTVLGTTAPACAPGSAVATATITKAQLQTGSFLEFDITPAVQSWLGSTANNGLALIPDPGLTAEIDSISRSGSGWPESLQIVLQNQGPQGLPGVSVSNAAVNSAGHLIQTLSSGQQLDAGYVVGPAGKDGLNGTNGKDGAPGAPGINGTNGVDGKNGVSVTGASVNSTGHLVQTFSNGASVDAGYVVGPAGQNGKDGAPGLNGTNGVDGKNGVDGVNGKDGVSFTFRGNFNANNEYNVNDVIYFTDGSSYIALQHQFSPSFDPVSNPGAWSLMAERGAQGATGPAGQNGLSIVGPQGLPGTNGTNGSNGADGVSVTGANVNAQGQLVESLSNGQQLNAGNVVGPQGIQGIAGVSGISVVSATVNSNGHLIETLSNGQQIDTGNVVGPQGASAPITVTPVWGSVNFSGCSNVTPVAGGSYSCTFIPQATQQSGGLLQGVSYSWSVSNPSVTVSPATSTDFSQVTFSGINNSSSSVTFTVNGTATAGTQTMPVQLFVTVNRPPQVVSSIQITNSGSSTLFTGQQTTLSALVLDQYGVQISNPTLIWTSSNPSVATVNNSGVVTGLTAGTTYITASNGSVTSNSVTINDPAAALLNGAWEFTAVVGYGLCGNGNTNTTYVLDVNFQQASNSSTVTVPVLQQSFGDGSTSLQAVMLTNCADPLYGTFFSDFTSWGYESSFWGILNSSSNLTVSNNYNTNSFTMQFTVGGITHTLSGTVNSNGTAINGSFTIVGKETVSFTAQQVSPISGTWQGSGTVCNGGVFIPSSNVGAPSCSVNNPNFGAGVAAGTTFAPNFCTNVNGVNAAVQIGNVVFIRQGMGNGSVAFLDMWMNPSSSGATGTPTGHRQLSLQSGVTVQTNTPNGTQCGSNTQNTNWQYGEQFGWVSNLNTVANFIQ